MKIRLALVTTALSALLVALSLPSAHAFGNGGGGHSGGGHFGGGGHEGGRSGGGGGGWHHHDGHHFYGGVGIGFWDPYWDPWLWGWDYPPYDGDYYVPAYPVYSTPNELPAPPSYWYYCPSVKTYYPYVAHCPEAWVRVTPSTPQ